MGEKACDIWGNMGKGGVQGKGIGRRCAVHGGA